MDQVTGFICPLDDADAFVAALSRLSAEQDLYRQQSRAARNRAVWLFSRDMVIATIWPHTAIVLRQKQAEL